MIVTRARTTSSSNWAVRPGSAPCGYGGGDAERDKDLLQHGLLIGKAISEYKENFGRGDFLVRNLVGADDKTGGRPSTATCGWGTGAVPRARCRHRR